jgi:hypothetical protein
MTIFDTDADETAAGRDHARCMPGKGSAAQQARQQLSAAGLRLDAGGLARGLRRIARVAHAGTWEVKQDHRNRAGHGCVDSAARETIPELRALGIKNARSSDGKDRAAMPP